MKNKLQSLIQTFYSDLEVMQAEEKAADRENRNVAYYVLSNKIYQLNNIIAHLEAIVKEEEKPFSSVDLVIDIDLGTYQAIFRCEGRDVFAVSQRTDASKKTIYAIAKRFGIGPEIPGEILETCIKPEFGFFEVADALQDLFEWYIEQQKTPQIK